MGMLSHVGTGVLDGPTAKRHFERRTVRAAGPYKKTKAAGASSRPTFEFLT